MVEFSIKRRHTDLVSGREIRGRFPFRDTQSDGVYNIANYICNAASTFKTRPNMDPGAVAQLRDQFGFECDGGTDSKDIQSLAGRHHRTP